MKADKYDYPPQEASLVHKPEEKETRHSRMQILLFSPYPLVEGGVVTFNTLLASTFSQAIDVNFFTIGRRPGREKKFNRFIQTIRDCLTLVQKIWRTKYHIAHVNPTLDLSSGLRDALFLLILHLFGKQKILVFFRGWEVPVFEQIVKNRLLLFLFKKLFLGVNGIVVLGSVFKDELCAIGVPPSKIRVFTTMFDGREFQYLKRNITTNLFHFCYLGRYVDGKGLIDLLEAFRMTTNLYNDIHLSLAGAGPLEQEMQQWVGDNKMTDKVSVYGYLRGVDKVQFLHDRDCFILPSSSEGCPNALIEAMAAGLVVISTPVGGIPDIIEENVNGILLKDISPQSIARAMKNVLQNPAWCNSMKEKNKRTAGDQFESKMVTQKIEELYHELLLPNGDKLQ